MVWTDGFLTLSYLGKKTFSRITIFNGDGDYSVELVLKLLKDLNIQRERMYNIYLTIDKQKRKNRFKSENINSTTI